MDLDPCQCEFLALPHPTGQNVEIIMPKFSIASFHVSENVLSDNSSTFDVYASNEETQVLIACPTDHHTAEEIARALSHTCEAFLSCDSTHGVTRLANELDRVTAKYLKH
jgi:hypothetical protein